MTSQPTTESNSSSSSVLAPIMESSQDVVPDGQSQEGLAGVFGFTLSEVQSGKRNPTTKDLNKRQSQIKSSQAQISLNKQIKAPAGFCRLSNFKVVQNRPGSDMLQQLQDQTFPQLGNEMFQQPADQMFQQPVDQMFQQPVDQIFQQPVDQMLQQPVGQMFQQPENENFQQPGDQTFQQPGYQMFLQSGDQMFQQPGYRMSPQPGHVYVGQQFYAPVQHYQRPFPHIGRSLSHQQYLSQVQLQLAPAFSNQRGQFQGALGSQVGQDLLGMPDYSFYPNLSQLGSQKASVQMGFLQEHSGACQSSAYLGTFSAPVAQGDSHIGASMMHRAPTGKLAPINEQTQRKAFNIILESGKNQAAKRHGLPTPETSPLSFQVLDNRQGEPWLCKTTKKNSMAQISLGMKIAQTAPPSRKRKRDSQKRGIIKLPIPKQALYTRQGIPKWNSNGQYFQSTHISPNSAISPANPQCPLQEFLQGDDMAHIWPSQSTAAQASSTQAPSAQAPSTQVPSIEGPSAQAERRHANHASPSEIVESSCEGTQNLIQIDSDLMLYQLISEHIAAPLMDRNDSAICLNNDEELSANVSNPGNDITQDVSNTAATVLDDGELLSSPWAHLPSAVTGGADSDGALMPGDPSYGHFFDDLFDFGGFLNGPFNI